MPRGQNKEYVTGIIRPKRKDKYEDTTGSVTFCRHGNCLGHAERYLTTERYEFFGCSKCGRSSRLPKLDGKSKRRQRTITPTNTLE